MNTKSKVKVSIYWPDDWKYCIIEKNEWEKVKKGEKMEFCGEGYEYEGEVFDDFWEFNHDGLGSLIVSYNDGGIGFDGLIDECEIEFIE